MGTKMADDSMSRIVRWPDANVGDSSQVGPKRKFRFGIGRDTTNFTCSSSDDDLDRYGRSFEQLVFYTSPKTNSHKETTT